ncbi:hypothetical protein G6F32_017003 [Rhizopus arrhizus]|nr:hypothetical protein G6F32_017003 [Rhizopus arrhizus]
MRSASKQNTTVIEAVELLDRRPGADLHAVVFAASAGQADRGQRLGRRSGEAVAEVVVADQVVQQGAGVFGGKAGMGAHGDLP